MTTPNEELQARLPELPEPAYIDESEDVSGALIREGFYSAEQLQDYAIAALARQEEGREAPYGWLEPSTGNFVDHATKLEMPNAAASFTLPIYTHPAPPIAALAPHSGGEGDAVRNDVHRVVDEGDGYWKPCSGCYESVEGYENSAFPYSDTFRCRLGGGCAECGGLGVVWEQLDFAVDDTPTPQAAGDEGRVGEMTPERACYFLRRFKADEKMLGPNEQWALDFAIEQLTTAGQQAAGVSEAVVERALDSYHASDVPGGFWPSTSTMRMFMQDRMRAALEAVWPTAAGAAPEGWVERIAAVTSEPPPKLLCAQNLTFDYGWASAMERVRSMLAAPQPGAQHGQEGRPDV